MQNYPSKDWSYGVELEYGNCSRKCVLPEGSKWNDLDNTCVSSTGIANDPKGELYEFGGEINTKPTNTIAEQLDVIQSINDSLSPSPIVNYRSNLHIHIRVPGLRHDLAALKQLLTYVHEHAPVAFGLVEPIPYPNQAQAAHKLEWEMKRYKRRQKSHQHRLSQKQFERMMAATTPEEFFEAEAHKDAKGNPAWFQVPRAGINIRQIYEHSETLEFRHFPGTTDMREMKYALMWCHDFMNAALNAPSVTPDLIWRTQAWKMPQFQPYEYETEQVYQYTNFDKHSRKVVAERLDKLRERIDIDDINTPSEEVYAHMCDIENIVIEETASLPL